MNCPTLGAEVPEPCPRAPCDACREALDEKLKHMSLVSTDEKLTNGSRCILWTGSTRRDGYGQLTIGSRSMGRGKVFSAHRIAWICSKGSIPNGMCVMHACDNKLCINIGHLSIGTQSDNMRDCWNKGRNAIQRYPERFACRGEDNPRARLSIQDVTDIRLSNESCRKLAEKYRCSYSAIWDARRGRSWKTRSEADSLARQQAVEAMPGQRRLVK